VTPRAAESPSGAPDGKEKKKEQTKLPAAPAEGRPLVVLIGRPNSGKSSLFNALTGGDAHVGNFPGITVDILEGDLRLSSGVVAEVADLPGLYSIDAVVDPSTDEGVARTFLDRAMASDRPFVVLQVIDVTRLALGLRLTRELVARGLPLVVVATQRDVLEDEGRTLDVAALETELGVPVLFVSARTKSTRDVVQRAVLGRLAAPPPEGAAGHAIPDRESTGAWNADKLASRVVHEATAASQVSLRRRTATARADAVLLQPILGPILFLSLMAAVFAAVFLIAEPVTAVLDALNASLRTRIAHALGEGLVSSFLADGLLGGAGTVLAFMPQILILSTAMELLESSGYLARGAFLVDRSLRFMGLSGRSFLPLLMAHACAVPAIAATRVIRDPRERLTTILVLPLMTCSARVPTYALILTTFFPARGALFKALLFVALYFIGIFSGLIASLVLRRTATHGRSLPLVLEMPAYRAPQPKVVARKAARTAWRFMRDVGTSILAVSAILWVLLTVPARSAVAGEAPIERSIAASVGHALEPVTKPLGFDWRIDVGLIGSFGARELMVGTMGVIFGVEDAGNDAAPLSRKMRDAKSPDGSPTYTTRTALALLAFFVFACQCMSTVAAIRRETRSWRWPAFVLAYTYGIAYAAAFIVSQLARLAGIA
jgi:ferrous iron transport protein B